MTAADSSTSPPPAEGLSVYYPIDPQTGMWGEPVIVDAAGNPVPFPPPYEVIPPSAAGGKPVVYLLDSDSAAYIDATGAQVGSTGYLQDPTTGAVLGLPTYSPPGTPAPPESPAIDEDESPPGDLSETEEPEEEGGGTAGTAEEAPAEAPEAGQVGTTDTTGDASSVGLTDEELQGPAPSPMESAPQAGVVGLGVQEMADLTAAVAGPVEVAGVVDLSAGQLADMPGPAMTEPVPAETAGVIGMAAEEIATPPVSRPAAEPVQVAGVVGLRGGEVADLPQPMPERVEGAGVVGLAAEQFAAAGGPSPEPVEMAGVVVRKEVAVDQPIPEPTPEPVQAAGVAGLAAEQIADLRGPLPGRVQMAGVVGLPAEEIAAVARPTRELDQGTGQVDFSDGATGEVPGGMPDSPVASYRADSAAAQPIVESVEAADGPRFDIEEATGMTVPTPESLEGEGVRLSTEDDTVPPIPPPDEESPWHPEDEDVPE